MSALWRFIPAGAGNTSSYVVGLRAAPVYPRWRGEHSLKKSLTAFAAGLSPLARGTLPQTLGDARKERFIPAGAGNTFFFRRGVGEGAVYPRWRGEHQRIKNEKFSYRGLSPLARGTH